MHDTLLLFSAVVLLHYSTAKVKALSLLNQTVGSGGGYLFEAEDPDFPILCEVSEFDCVYSAREDTAVTIPCGKYERAAGISFTYYEKNSLKVLANSTTNYPQFALTWNDDGVTVCCVANISLPNNFIQDSTCYQLNVSYAPIIANTDVTGGGNRSPVYGEPMTLICPLQSNPPAEYAWKRYSIDGSQSLNISTDVKFTEGGQHMEMVAYRPDIHNGLYVCEASNSLGSKEYRNSNRFLLSTTFCSRFKTADISTTISPSGELQYKPGVNITLNCSLYPVQAVGQRPFWYFINHHSNGSVSVEYVRSSNARQQTHYDEKKCVGMNTLTIYNFSDELSGTYSCGFSTHVVNQTLKLLSQEERVSVGDKSHTWLFILIPSVLVAVVIATIGILVAVAVCVRRRLRVGRCAYSTSKEPPSDGFVYDVFISAHDEVRGIVQHKILHLLEKRDPPYKVCWHLRDFTVGFPINEQIAYSIAKSRKIVFVFSEHFVESQFCCSELDHALHRFQTTRTRCIVPIVLNEDTVPQKVKALLTYWPLVRLNDADFLEKITRILGDPVDSKVTEIHDDTTRLLE